VWTALDYDNVERINRGRSCSGTALDVTIAYAKQDGVENLTLGIEKPAIGRHNFGLDETLSDFRAIGL
jgi:hypothetical protein